MPDNVDYVLHTLKPGETLRSLAKKHCPGLDGDALMIKIREIYAFNLAHGNPVQAWDIKPGVQIYLPRD